MNLKQYTGAAAMGGGIKSANTLHLKDLRRKASSSTLNSLLQIGMPNCVHIFLENGVSIGNSALFGLGIGMSIPNKFVRFQVHMNINRRRGGMNGGIKKSDSNI
jgi:hypothetical protein